MKSVGVMPVTSVLVALCGQETGGVALQVTLVHRGRREAVVRDYPLDRGLPSSAQLDDIVCGIGALVTEAIVTLVGVQEILPGT